MYILSIFLIIARISALESELQYIEVPIHFVSKNLTKDHSHPKNHFSNISQDLSSELFDNITNDVNVQIATKIYIGSQKQEMSMLLDTGSTFIWLASRICENCHIADN